MLLDCSYEVGERATRVDVIVGVVAQRASNIHSAGLPTTSSTTATHPNVRTASPLAKDHGCVDAPMGRRAQFDRSAGEAHQLIDDGETETRSFTGVLATAPESA